MEDPELWKRFAAVALEEGGKLSIIHDIHYVLSNHPLPFPIIYNRLSIGHGLRTILSVIRYQIPERFGVSYGFDGSWVVDSNFQLGTLWEQKDKSPNPYGFGGYFFL